MGRQVKEYFNLLPANYRVNAFSAAEEQELDLKEEVKSMSEAINKIKWARSLEGFDYWCTAYYKFTNELDLEPKKGEQFVCIESNEKKGAGWLFDKVFTVSYYDAYSQTVWEEKGNGIYLDSCFKVDIEKGSASTFELEEKKPINKKYHGQKIIVQICRPNISVRTGEIHGGRRITGSRKQVRIGNRHSNHKARPINKEG